ncbi:hypothetical protein D046_7314A, partial [Vibrio parahaemolyticus V-223/04]
MSLSKSEKAGAMTYEGANNASLQREDISGLL